MASWIVFLERGEDSSFLVYVIMNEGVHTMEGAMDGCSFS